MLKEPSPQQHELEMISLESLVPDTHLLRNIDQYIDFEFIRDRVRHFYCSNNGQNQKHQSQPYRSRQRLHGSRRQTQEGYLPKRAYTYDAATNTYQCPQGQSLIYATTNRLGYREYKSNPSHCRDCPLLSQCSRSANYVKVLTRHIWQDSKEHTTATD
tara:strand:- start:2856 stop:3329 length:474 start_codon:yes stop_codon:yes gene_type:complete